MQDGGGHPSGGWATHPEDEYPADWPFFTSPVDLQCHSPNVGYS